MGFLPAGIKRVPRVPQNITLKAGRALRLDQPLHYKINFLFPGFVSLRPNLINLSWVAEMGAGSNLESTIVIVKDL